MLNAEAPIRKSAEAIGRHRSTIYREIKRNAFGDEELPELNGYYGMIAQKDALPGARGGASCKGSRRFVRSS